MADAALDEAARARQLANTLRVDEVPAKLRCGMCNKLAVDAVKLLCCSTSICTPCIQEIPETCSICTHSPTSPDDCSPDKKLRNTVRAFIKTEEKKRNKATEPLAVTPAQEPTPAPALPEPAPSIGEAEEQAATGEASYTQEVEIVQSVDSAQATAGASTTDTQQEADGDTPNAAEDADQGAEEEEDEDDDDDVVITVDRPQEEEQVSTDHQQNGEYANHYTEQQYEEQSNGQQGNNYGQGHQGFGNMNNFNPMMAMGMGNFGMGMPNMMGMAGMNLDPSMMFANGGFGGMDMNAMMSMAGMGGMNGMGGFGGMMNMANGAGGFYGPGNSGGYNNHHQQQFGNQVNAPFHHQRGYYNRGRGGFGRGRGGSYPRGGRGGFNSYNQFPAGQNQNAAQQQYSQGFDSSSNTQQQADQETRQPVYEWTRDGGDKPGDTAGAEQHGENDGANGADGGTTNPTGDQQDGGEAAVAQCEVGGKSLVAAPRERQMANSSAGEVMDSFEDKVATKDMAQSQHKQVPVQQETGYARGAAGFSEGAYGNVTTIGGESEPLPAPPTNAPKGPKAMRQGLPNSGRYSRPQQTSMPPPAAPSLHAEHSQDHDSNARRGRSRTRSRSPLRYESRKHRERTPHGAYESEEAYAERKERERERRKRKEREREAIANGDELSDKTKSRSDSLDEHEKRKHRDRHDDRHSSRRDRSRDRRKHSDRSRSPEKTRSARGESSDRSRRKSKSDRVHESDAYDNDRAKDRRTSRKHSRREEDEYERSNKDRSKHSRSSKEDNRTHDRDRERRHATPEEMEDLGISIKGAARNNRSMGPPSAHRSSRDDRRASLHSSESTPATPALSAGDKYAADREAAIAERLKKHNQSLGLKRASRGEDEIREERGHRKRQRQDTRKHSARFE